MKIAKYSALFLVFGFFSIVLMEQLPGAMTPTADPHVSLFFGLFNISLLDDITHFISGLLGVLAVIAGSKWTVKYLMIIGGYYFLDSIFYIINGFATGQPVLDNLALNLPHVAIAVLVAFALTKSVKNIEIA